MPDPKSMKSNRPRSSSRLNNSVLTSLPGDGTYGNPSVRFSLSMASSCSAILPSLLTPNGASRRRSAAAIAAPHREGTEMAGVAHASFPDESGEGSDVPQCPSKGLTRPARARSPASKDSRRAVATMVFAAAGHVLQHDAGTLESQQPAGPLVDDPLDPPQHPGLSSAVPQHLRVERQPPVAVVQVKRPDDLFLAPDPDELPGLQVERVVWGLS